MSLALVWTLAAELAEGVELLCSQAQQRDKFQVVLCLSVMAKVVHILLQLTFAQIVDQLHNHYGLGNQLLTVTVESAP